MTNIPSPPSNDLVANLTEVKQKSKMDYAKDAAVTIISKNYLSFAHTLADSYKKHHPENDFIIALVDVTDDNIPAKLDCGAEIIEISQFRIPDFERFVYRYSILELNTAVKPFVLSHLFASRNYDTLTYIDPDIWIFHPLDELYQAFKHASIVLTPHLRTPYYDTDFPNDIHILQSGTYNLGFIGVKNNHTGQQLLDWWKHKLYQDCIVDIANGLFVDQKWIDLIPGFFPDHKIVHDATYNVAYWNLHERMPNYHDNQWWVDDKPLRFFHFSGYTPFAPDKLSKHQTRYQLYTLPQLKHLTDAYAKVLFKNGYAQSSSWKYAYATLSNGVKLPMEIVRDIMQWVSRNNVKSPSPISNPDKFCQFLLSDINMGEMGNTTLLFYFLLKRRPDVATKYPNALHNRNDPEFRIWLENSGIQEEGLGDILRFDKKREIGDHVSDLFEQLRKNQRSDVFLYFNKLWIDDKVFDEFCSWIVKHGIKEIGLQQEHSDALKEAKPGIYQILNIYFYRGDLQLAFPSLYNEEQSIHFRNWLYQHQHECHLTPNKISLFYEFSLACQDLLTKLSFLYANFNKKMPSSPSIYDLDDQSLSIPNRQAIVQWLCHEKSIRPVDHFIAKFGNTPTILKNNQRKYNVGLLSPKENYSFTQSIQQAFKQKREKPIVNLTGFFSVPSGMGESSRSLSACLQYAEVECTRTVLPHPFAQSHKIPHHPILFGWPNSFADLAISVANADTTERLSKTLPSTFWAPKNIAYWVWETEKLPEKFCDVDELFDEIWTPSQYSAQAIKATCKHKSIKVLPHTLDFNRLNRAKANRAKFALPDQGTLFGYIFDPLSILERKNVLGLIRTFQQAFREDDNCYLILKVNGQAQGHYDFEHLKAQAESKRIKFYQSTLSRDDTFHFLKSLDVYVSLHRSEGFGLTCAEAMALGIPTIASNYSGNLEFMDHSNSLLVDTRIVQSERPYGPYPIGSNWGEPDMEHAVHLFRQVLTAEKRNELGERGSISVREKLSPQRIGRKTNQYIQEILKSNG